MQQFEIALRRRDIRNEELIADLKRVSISVGKQTVTRAEYDALGRFGATTVVRKLGTWNAAVVAAGLEIANRQNIGVEELFENLADIWATLGSQPFGRHMSDRNVGSRFSLATYEKRFGSWNKTLIAFASFIGSEGDGQADVNRSKPDGTKARSPRGVNWRLRAQILIRDSCICRMCGASPAKDATTVLHIDHIIPWSKGGETIETNLQTLCERCNLGKSNVL